DAKPARVSALAKPKPKAVSAKPAKPAQAAKTKPDKKKPALAAQVIQPARVEPRPMAGERRVEQMRVSYASTEMSAKQPAGIPDLIAEARKYLGTNPTDRAKLWCARFMNFVLARAGYAGTGSDAAKSFAYYGRRISEPRVGAIAVLMRGKNG